MGRIWPAARGARRRRDLGADALGPPAGGRGRRRALPRHRGDAPLAANPSFLDMRNAILQANQVGVLDGRTDHKATIWQVFAARGMGFFAATEDATTRRRSRASRFRPTRRTASARSPGSTDADTGKPVAGASGRVRRPRLLDTTDALGQYSIADVPVGTYPQVVASKAGYDRDIGVERRHRRRHRGRSTSRSGATGRRSTAAGGSRVHRAELHAVRLRADHAIDQSTGTGWSTIRPNLAPTARARSR